MSCQRIMALPNLRNIFASFRSPLEERQMSRSAFYKFLGFILVSTSMSLVALSHHKRTTRDLGGSPRAPGEGCEARIGSRQYNGTISLQDGMTRRTSHGVAIGSGALVANACHSQSKMRYGKVSQAGAYAFGRTAAE
ncbi:hypothetical protein RTBOTA2_002041 [Rhodotorula toruloides]|nr:hypothetical protein RTBOTA2_002041 [Rhodotorula toruloides]